MVDPLRQEIAAAANTIVVKVGTRVLTHENGTLNESQIAVLSEQLHAVASQGRRVVLVSSGAVGAGMSELGLKKRPTDLARLQAVAAIGQAKLIETYNRSIRPHGRQAAQVLLTADDLQDRKRYLNVRNTLLSLLECGAIPIINENDTVAVDELMATFGDNDRLAALVTCLLGAPLLIILSDVAGLFDGDPALPTSRRIETVRQVDETVFAYAQSHKTGLSKGGMSSKLNAARIVTTAGENVIIASGRQPTVLTQLLQGEAIGTLFLGQGRAVSPWKRWIAFSNRPNGRIVLDQGACQAIVQQGRSLLAIGIVRREGEFEKGDIVAICDQQGRELARGLSNYPAAEIDRIQGRNSTEIPAILGYRSYDEVIHRDNLVIVVSP